MPDSLEDRFQNLHEFVTQARINLNRNNWDYLIGGSETETTLARNRLGLIRLAFGHGYCAMSPMSTVAVRCFAKSCASRYCAPRSARCKCSSRAAVPPSPRRHASSAMG